MMRSGNPVLSNDIFANATPFEASKSMTIQGTVNKTFLLLFIVIMCASFAWNNPVSFLPLMIPAAILGFVMALITAFAKKWAFITSPIYAVFEGIFLGTISLMFETKYPGIVVQAIGLTFGTLFCLLVAYKSRLIQATENFKLGVFAATGGIALLYFVNIILNFFGVRIPLIHESGIIGIGFSAFVVVIAALNLVLDFDFIESGAQAGAPKYMEWYGAFGLMVTLIWLYMEILRLLAKLRRR